MDVEFSAPVFSHLSDGLRAVIEGQEHWCMVFSGDRIHVAYLEEAELFAGFRTFVKRVVGPDHPLGRLPKIFFRQSVTISFLTLKNNLLSLL
jgi:hypothetical protein